MQDLTRPRWRPPAACAALLAVMALAACERPASSPSAGQRVDDATARAEQKAHEAKEGVKSAAADAAKATERAGAEVSDKVKDAAITTSVNAKITQDKQLSVMRINVDTVDGRVLLRGSAPDAASAQRAQQLAASVDGVVSVDNQLVIGGKG
jgi:hyperosmotically inducible protein